MYFQQCFGIEPPCARIALKGLRSCRRQTLQETQPEENARSRCIERERRQKVPTTHRDVSEKTLRYGWRGKGMCGWEMEKLATRDWLIWC